MPTVLIIEDEPKLRELVRSYLERDGLAVLSAASGSEGLHLAKTAGPDLVVLDLPDISGEAVATEMRAVSTIPIVILTARAEEADRIRGFELGADDYVVKPFSPRELVLRVRAVLRRGTGAEGSQAVAELGGRLVIDETRRTAVVDGVPRDLTATEWNLLLALASQPGRVYSRAELINRARGHEFSGYERSVDSHIKNLRRKIEVDPAHPEIVLTVVGGGYRLGLTRDA
ncbi:MAG TPA: response regulator transcription factor [Mycobacteriales bacterium]|nr:response regulator transcription factor [Mycobacteriales bacterium]